MNVMKRLFAFSLVLFMAPLGQAVITAHQLDSPAQDSAKTVSGEVVSVDSDKNEVVIKDNAGAEVRQTPFWRQRLPSFAVRCWIPGPRRRKRLIWRSSPRNSIIEMCQRGARLSRRSFSAMTAPAAIS